MTHFYDVFVSNLRFMLRYSMLTGFEAQASGAVLDLTGDDDQAMRSKKNCVKWDVKKRKYVKADQSSCCPSYSLMP